LDLKNVVSDDEKQQLEDYKKSGAQAAAIT